MQPMQIPGYRIERQIGSGAMASVYLAIQESLDREVALKIMAPALVADESFCQRFLKEGKIIAKLSHPYIVTIFDIGVHQSCYYMAVEYVGGGTLKSRIGRGLDPAEAVTILCQIAEALGYAHQRGFLHRDVKPANILFRDNGQAVLSDFGIAKTLAGGTQMTAQGFAVGTPSYMSPEQAMGEPLDARCDLYSLGVVFYEMLTGNKPYLSEDSFAVALMHVSSPLPRLPQRLAQWQPILDRLLAKRPAERFASAGALIQAVRAAQTARPPGPDDATRVLDTTVIRKPPPPRRRRMAVIAWAAGLGLTVAAAGAAWYAFQPDGPAPQGPVAAIPPPLPELLPPPERTPPERPAMDQQTREQVGRLLEVAQAHYDVGYLTDPPGSNAADTYRRVLDLDPDNPQAQAGLRAIAEEYAQMARQRLDQGDAAAALALVKAGLGVAPEHAGLRGLRERIER